VYSCGAKLCHARCQPCNDTARKKITARLPLLSHLTPSSKRHAKKSRAQAASQMREPQPQHNDNPCTHIRDHGVHRGARSRIAAAGSRCVCVSVIKNSCARAGMRCSLYARASGLCWRGQSALPLLSSPLLSSPPPLSTFDRSALQCPVGCGRRRRHTLQSAQFLKSWSCRHG
jgi:hypothetical protein